MQPLRAAEAPSHHSRREFAGIGIPVVETRIDRMQVGGSRAFRVKTSGSSPAMPSRLKHPLRQCCLKVGARSLWS
jgi:hypothetical protein